MRTFRLQSSPKLARAAYKLADTALADCRARACSAAIFLLARRRARGRVLLHKNVGAKKRDGGGGGDGGGCDAAARSSSLLPPPVAAYRDRRRPIARCFLLGDRLKVFLRVFEAAAVVAAADLNS